MVHEVKNIPKDTQIDSIESSNKLINNNNKDNKNKENFKRKNEKEIRGEKEQNVSNATDCSTEKNQLIRYEQTNNIDDDKKSELIDLLKHMNISTDQIIKKDTIKGKTEYKFWNTQPVPSLNDNPQTHGPIDPIQTPSDVRQIPYKLPKGFEWSDINLSDSIEAKEVYDLLTENYVEDDDNMFRFDYSIEFLKWALLPPNYISTWHLGIRCNKNNNNKLMAFISGIPATIRVYETKKKMAEINFLCIHKKLRTKRLAPVLIKEITRRIRLHDIWQAVYTAGVVLPNPVSKCRYYHRSLNPKKLIETGFSRLPPKMTLTRIIKHYKLSSTEPISEGFRQMMEEDIPQVYKLIKSYLRNTQKFNLVPFFENEEEIKHWLLPREGVVSSYVICNKQKKITDFCSFYHLPSSIIGNDKYKTLHAAYSYYNIATSVSLIQLMNDCLIMAKKNNFDVFNALNLMENDEFLEKLLFGIGDGDLQFYLYNWMCPRMEPKKVGLVLC